MLQNQKTFEEKITKSISETVEEMKKINSKKKAN